MDMWTQFDSLGIEIFWVAVGLVLVTLGTRIFRKPPEDDE